MLSLLSFLVSAFFMFFLAIGEPLGSLNVLGWGLFFFVLGHLLSGVGPAFNSWRD